MYEEYQIEIPQSFLTLFVEPGRAKPNAPHGMKLLHVMSFARQC